MSTAYGQRLVHARRAELDELGDDALVAAVHLFDERREETTTRGRRAARLL